MEVGFTMQSVPITTKVVSSNSTHGEELRNNLFDIALEDVTSEMLILCCAKLILD
jgi:hypothetical protein